MNKLWLIVQREYLTRVKKRAFILTTLLIPLGLVLFYAAMFLIMSYEDEEKIKIAVVDEGGIMNKVLKDENDLYFSFPNENLADLKGKVEKEEYSGVLVVPKPNRIEVKDFTINYYSENQLSMTNKVRLEQKIGDKIRDYKIAELNLDKEQLDKLRSKVTIDPEPIKEGDKDSTSMTGLILGGVGGLLGTIIFFIVFINGTQVMMGVMEEKTNRIVEVMVSSVKPFELMLGKVLGIGGVTLTQMLIWAILFPLIFMGAQLFLGFDFGESQVAAANANAGVDPEQVESFAFQLMQEVGNINWFLILSAFAVYLLLGFFMYGSLYAAVGSAVGDDMAEAQKLSLPIALPISLSFYLIFPVMNAPNGTLAVWASIFPISSPFIMPARLAFDPPLWQVGLSLVVLIATTIFFVWFAGRIYRVGIFLYGKKATFSEMAKWIFYKG